jgi:predicted nucleic acid-binding protein
LVLLDSSAVLAILDAADRNHAPAILAAAELVRLRCRVFQTSWLRAETHALLLVRLGHEAARRWLSEPPPSTVRPQPIDETEAEAVVNRYRDKSYSLCDALSFTIMERLKATAAFTFDRHFRQHNLPTFPTA